MRKIKFRGKDKKTGQLVYGNLRVYGDLRVMPFQRKEIYSILERGEWDASRRQVDSESVAQFVGYDSSGKEIYEGDVLIDPEGNEHVATLGTILNLAEYSIGERFFGYFLKGSEGDENLP